MNINCLQARSALTDAAKLLYPIFGKINISGSSDAVFTDPRESKLFGVTGLLFYAPVCDVFLNNSKISDVIISKKLNLLISVSDGIKLLSEKGEEILPSDVTNEIKLILNNIYNSKGVLSGGSHIIDLINYPVGPHFDVNLLLGDRTEYPYPLFTTPKSVTDSLGRGSFRAGGAKQVLATRYVYRFEENGEPGNRQFYLIEDGKKIFYSADVKFNVKKAECLHKQNITKITYLTECGLLITRTIFILPQKEGMPEAVETQRITIENKTKKDRTLKIIVTGTFGICSPETIVNDVVYANVVHESEIYKENGNYIALALHNKDKALKNEKKFTALLSNGEGFDEYCSGLNEFLGTGTLENPECLCKLPCRPALKSASFFALAKTLYIKAYNTAEAVHIVGMSENISGEDVSESFKNELGNLITYFRENGATEKAENEISDNYKKYSSYINFTTENKIFNDYAGKNLPFQVLYQTFVSRSFAWTQKAYRETGFREIQDIFASMYYLAAAGKAKLVKELISEWVKNVFKMGYAYHDFTFKGKAPGDCSDDQLWLVQAVTRYIKLTGDYGFLDEEFSVAGTNEKRSLKKTLEAIIIYSGKISVGIHGLPLLDKADWNDTLRLDKTVYNGTEKEEIYNKQLEKSGKPYGSPLENKMTESVMNACLLKIACDGIGEITKDDKDKRLNKLTREISNRVGQTVKTECWKEDFFARALINDGRKGGFIYLGAGKDGLSADKNIDGTYFLNSFSWTILSGIADETQIDKMTNILEKYLKVGAGLRLCTPVMFDLLGTDTATELYFPGDRENGGVFKHAAMMAASACFKAAKFVKSESLAKRLLSLGEFAINKVLPYKTMENPFVIKGNPRFCTQYNNSITGENIGPVLSGTATWLTLSLYEIIGIDESKESFTVFPILPENFKEFSYIISSGGTEITVKTVSTEGRIRLEEKSIIKCDGKQTEKAYVRKDGNKHTVEISL